MATKEMVTCLSKEVLKSFTTYRTDLLTFVALWMQRHYGIKKQMNREYANNVQCALFSHFRGDVKKWLL